MPGIFNLLMLVWTPGKESKVHDHAASHCLMKIMKGELKETRWVTPEGGARTAEEMDIEGVREYRRGKVAYMCDDVSGSLLYTFLSFCYIDPSLAGRLDMITWLTMIIAGSSFHCQP